MSIIYHGVDAAADWRTDGPIDCPFCGHELDELSDGHIACPTCEVWWDDRNTIERTRRELAAFPELPEENNEH